MKLKENEARLIQCTCNMYLTVPSLKQTRDALCEHYCDRCAYNYWNRVGYSTGALIRIGALINKNKFEGGGLLESERLL